MTNIYPSSGICESGESYTKGDVPKGIKLALGEYPVLHTPTLDEQGVQVVDDPKDADFIIHFSTEAYGQGYQIPNSVPPYPRSKSVMIQVEPPLAPYCQLVYYKNFLDQFHTAYVFNLNPEAKNQFPVTENPHLFPYPSGWANRVTRSNTYMSNQHKFYYAGGRYSQWGSPNAHGSVNLYPLRSQIVSYLIERGLAHYVIGDGWSKKTTRNDEDWRGSKLNEVIRNECDFVLCLENSRCFNYMSEKIHDGFNCDRVVFYLGCPNAHKFVPDNCFVNLSQPPYYKVVANPQPYTFNFEAVKDRILTMTQVEYDEILGHAREFRDTVLTESNYEAEARKLTLHLLNRLSQIPKKL